MHTINGENQNPDHSTERRTTDHFPSEQDSHFTLATHAGWNKPGKTGNRAVLLLLSKAALSMTETICENGFSIYLDELYDINAEGKNILILREE